LHGSGRIAAAEQAEYRLIARRALQSHQAVRMQQFHAIGRTPHLFRAPLRAGRARGQNKVFHRRTGSLAAAG
jgi:hypothetical protein